MLSSKVTKVDSNAVVYESNGQTHSVEADKVLMSIGRRPATEGLGLENIGVELERGRVKVDEKCQTNVPGVYAAGDVNGKSMLAHTAYRESEVAVNNMLGKRIPCGTMPLRNLYQSGSGCVGETEQTAADKGMNLKQLNCQ